MINLSPHILPGGREIFLEKHDNGINLRACPFSRTGWIMFLCFPLDYQTKGYIEQVVNYFGTVLTWTSNSNCKSRVLVRCSVLHTNKIPRSVLVCKPAVVGGAGLSWTVPVFVLNSQNNEPILGDEDPIPEDGNPHPFPGPQLENQHNDYWENVQDLNDIEHANVDEGWEPPLLPNAAAAATGANLGNDWHVWP
jgi:hypothetical protein